jgi:hypothetical protein
VCIFLAKSFHHPDGSNFRSALQLSLNGSSKLFFIRYFWFRWKDERVQVGTGSAVGSSMLMEYSKANHPAQIASVGISTGWEVTGRWEISYLEGKKFIVLFFTAIFFKTDFVICFL